MRLPFCFFILTAGHGKTLPIPAPLEPQMNLFYGFYPITAHLHAYGFSCSSIAQRESPYYNKRISIGR